MSHIVVSPAYGVVLNSQAEIKAHYLAGRDFTIQDIFHGAGRKINRQDAENGNVSSLQVRYGKRGEKVACIDVAKMSRVQS